MSIQFFNHPNHFCISFFVTTVACTFCRDPQMSLLFNKKTVVINKKALLLIPSPVLVLCLMYENQCIRTRGSSDGVLVIYFALSSSLSYCLLFASSSPPMSCLNVLKKTQNTGSRVTLLEIHWNFKTCLIGTGTQHQTHSATNDQYITKWCVLGNGLAIVMVCFFLFLGCFFQEVTHSRSMTKQVT